ncbi:MAG: PQQ-binding-like beta-propeller repeat protein [Candidatus Aenigmarchaeota archaeon]|nr:PQQ-binding-like beta-propeller repeat protein [Candidatus Aenigmarchaeota archaeon]
MDNQRKKSITLVVVSIVLAFVIFSAAGISGSVPVGQDWPVYMQGGNHSSISANTTIIASNAGTISMIWNLTTVQSDFNHGLVYISPQSPADDYIVYGLANGSVLILNASSGAQFGNYTCGFNSTVGANYSIGSPAISNGIMYIGCGNNGLHAVNITNLSAVTALWIFNLTDWTEVSPVIRNNVVFTAAYSGNVTAINATTGQKIWSQSIGGFPAASPALGFSGTYLFETNGGLNKTFALNVTDGSKLWNFTADNGLDTTPVFRNGILYIGSSNGTIYALNATNGSQIWNRHLSPYTGQSYASPIVSSDGGTVIVGSGNGSLDVLNSTNGLVILNAYLGGGSITYPGAIANNVLFIGNNQTFFVINMDNGSVIKNFTLGSVVNAPVVVGNKVAVRTWTGSVYVFSVQPGSSVTFSSITPNSVIQGTGLVVVNILGSGFQAGAKVYLTSGGVPFYNLTNVTIASDGNTLNATINTSDTAITAQPSVGINITNPDNSTVNQVGAFAINSSSTASLIIWSENDSGRPFGNQARYTGDLILFFANYTNLTSGKNITGATCLYNLTGASPSNMSYNVSTGLYFINKSIPSPGTKFYSTVCNATGHTVITITSNITITDAPSGGGSSSACTSPICLSNAFNSTGNQTVKICSATPTVIRDFNIWYNGTGPFNLTGVNGFVILQANYTNTTGDAYSNSLGLNTSIGGGCVNFVLNGTLAPFTTLPIQINVTVNNITNYATGASQCISVGCNGTMFTTNFISILTRDSNSALVANTLIMAFDNVTKSYTIAGPAMTDTNGYYAQHCLGVISAGVCKNTTGGTTNGNLCAVNGIPFPATGSPPSNSRPCDVNTTTSFIAYDFITSNVSVVTNVTPGITAQTVLNNAAAVGFIMPTLYSSSPGFSNYLNVSSTTVKDNSGAIIYYATPQSSDGGPKGGAPFFATANNLYTISVNISGYGVYSYPYMPPVTGMTGVDLIIPNRSSTSFTTFVGKVVNETGSVVANATVYAQFAKNSGGSFGIQLVNSTTTDSNGRFTISVPTTVIVSNEAFPVYQFYIVSSKTNNGVPVYFPTVDNNDGNGYFAQGTTAILNPMKIKAGGRVDVNVTLSGASLVLTELSKIQSLGTGDSRSAVTGKFSMLSIFSGVNPPTFMTISLLAPVSTSRVYYNAFGKNQSLGGSGSSESIVGTCTNVVSVTQGAVTSSNCLLGPMGYLNLSVTTYNDIFDLSGGSSVEGVAGSKFWDESYLILKDVNKNVTLFLSPGGSLLQDLIGYGAFGSSLRVPVPSGNYSVNLVKARKDGRFLSVYNVSNISIPASTTVNYNVRRSGAWQIRPQFPGSLSLSMNTTLLATVFSPQTISNLLATVFSPQTISNGGFLNGSRVVLKGQVLYLDKTNATSPAKTVSFTFNSAGAGVPEGFRGMFNATALGITGGKYLLMLNATNVSSDVSFESTTFVPIVVSDFTVGFDTGGMTFGTGQNVTAKIFAFDTSTNPPIGVNASGNSGLNTPSSNVSIAVYDPSGSMALYNYNATPLVNGEGSANITLPTAVGFYQIVSTVSGTNGKQGISETWVQVSNFNIKSILDRQNYQPTDTVLLTVQVLNASSNSPISSASVEVVVDNGNTPALAVTGTDGKASIKLDPTTYSSTGQWPFGFRNLRIRVSKDTGIDVIKLDSYSGFEVRGFQSFVKTDKFSYSTTENVTVQIFLPPGILPTTVKGIVDGNATGAVAGSPINNQTWNIILGTRSPGHHNVEVKVAANGGIQSFSTGFDVNAYVIKTNTSSYSYRLNQNVTLSVSLNYLNGSSVVNKNVTATLYKAQPPNDINISFATSNTSSSGLVTLNLNASKAGFNYIRIDVEGQTQFIGFQVSSVSVSLLNNAGAVVTNYDSAPGSSLSILVNATSAGTNVPNGSVVTATIWAFGNPISLPTNTTIGGNSTIPVQIPSNAPAQVYGLDVVVTTPSGEQGFAPPSTLTVKGGNALQLRVRPDRDFLNSYSVGDNATFRLELMYPNNTGVSGENVSIEVGTGGGKPNLIGSAITDSAGSASLKYTISSNDTDGGYFIHAFITNNTDVQTYGGYSVSSLGVVANLSSTSVGLGGTTTVSISLVNRTSGSTISATSGFVSIFLPNKGEISQAVNVSTSQPYTLLINIPNESSAVGTYPMMVQMFVNSSRGTKPLQLDVRNSSQTLNMTLPSSITAGTSFLVNLTSTLNGTPSLAVFSPSADSLVYENKSIVLGGSNLNASLNVTINTPGTYVFKAFLTGVGSVKSVVKVSATSNVPIVWLQNSSAANVTNYTTSQSVYIYSNLANATATVLTFDNSTNTTISFDVPLNQLDGTNYYGVLANTNLVSGRIYFVRLDTSSATSVANKIFKVL